MKTTETNETRYVLLICLVGLTLTLPAFFSDFYSGHNALTHLNWSRQFAQQLWSGDVYPRWLAGMNNGLGSPAFFYYFPLPFYFTSLLHAPFLSLDPTGWLQIGISYAVAFLLSGLTCYLWLRGKNDPAPAFVGAIFYMIAPYHLLVDLYYRSAFAEFWAFVFIPLSLYFVDKMQQQKRLFPVGFSLSYALLFLSHLPTVLFFSPFLLGYLFFTAQPAVRVKAVARSIRFMLIGAGVAGFYWIPAILTQSNVSFVEMHNGEFFFGNNFLFSSINVHPKNVELGYYLSFLSYSTLITAFICLLSWMLAREKNSPRPSAAFWGGIVIISFFMMTEASSWLWQTLPLLHRIQFPYRFNVLLTLAGSMLVAGALSSIVAAKIGHAARIWIVLTSAFFLSQFIIVGVTVYERKTGHWDETTLQVIARELAFFPEVAEYLPRWANPQLFPVTSTQDQLGDFPDVMIRDGSGSASVLSRGPKWFILQINAISPMTLTLRHLYYPGWVASFDAGGMRAQIFPSKEEGFLSVTVPSGSHKLSLALKAGTTEITGAVISLFSAVLCLFLLLRDKIMMADSPRGVDVP